MCRIFALNMAYHCLNGRKRVAITLPQQTHPIGKNLAQKDRKNFSLSIEVLVERAVDALAETNSAARSEKEVAS